MKYEVYKVLHLLGIVTLLVSLGGAAVLTMIVAKRDEHPAVRKLLAALHGIAMLIVLVGGFGLMARTGIVAFGSWPGWIYGKLTVWIAFGASVGVLKRRPESARTILLLAPLIAAAAAWLAVFKPGSPG